MADSSNMASEAVGAARGGFVGLVVRLHDAVFGAISKIAGEWFVPTGARFAFASVLFFYFFNSALTKFGGAPFGLGPSDSVFPQILGEAFWLDYGGDPAAVPALFTPVAWAGMYGELILPILVLVGLFTRVAALGMVIFVFVQSYVDVTAHGLDDKSIGSFFDRFPDAIISDQRLLWVFVLLVLVIKGGGPFSVDRLLAGKFN